MERRRVAAISKTPMFNALEHPPPDPELFKRFGEKFRSEDLTDYKKVPMNLNI